MRRDAFLKSPGRSGRAGSLPMPALAATNIKMMIPANPGGGWDSTGRALGRSMIDSRPWTPCSTENKGGAAGIIGLASSSTPPKGDPNAVMVMGAVMLGGLIIRQSPPSMPGEAHADRAPDQRDTTCSWSMPTRRSRP